MQRLTSVRIRDIKGIEHLDLQLGTLTVISGANATGKTSILDALSAVFEGGHNPELVRNGRERGSVTLTLDDGTKIVKTITPKESELKVTTGDGSIVPRPAAFVQKLASGFAFDPLAFLEAEPKKRAQYLLEALPIVFQPEEVEAAGGGRPASVLNLQGYDSYRAGVYERRREVNVRVREMEGAVATIGKALGGEVDEELAAQAGELRKRAADLRSQREMTAAFLKSGLEADKEKARAEYEAKLHALESEAATTYQEETSALTAEIEQAQDNLSKAEEAERAVSRERASRQQRDELNKLAKDRLVESQTLTEQMAAIDELKKKKLAAQSLPGLEIVNGDISVNGVPLDQLNTQAQYFLAFQVASMQVGQLGLMICDRAESIVGERWNEFVEAAKESGYQVVATRAEADMPLTVEADGQPQTLFAMAGSYQDPGDPARKRKR